MDSIVTAVFELASQLRDMLCPFCNLGLAQDSLLGRRFRDRPEDFQGSILIFFGGKKRNE